MDGKILEIWERAVSETKNAGGDSSNLQSTFGELIVQECIDAVMETDRYRRDYFAHRIRRRFGMETWEEED